MDLGEAHTRASAFEKAVSAAFPAYDRVWTHMEPVKRQISNGTESAFYQDEKIKKLILELPQVLGVQCEIHEITLLKESERLNISFHCFLHRDTPIQDAHELSERMESTLRGKITNLDNVVIHMEPLD